ncbi:hypothetical protein KFE25_001824 [Diacronema lutheri]|uniref:Uncharacterized protein n=1 Tax=Diacronema lutheri TaxID=2081491 RepID=A0A8J5XCL5_DIALT|nr:hypothetical protein KFE25_001824 [Diacronema lutheri]
MHSASKNVLLGASSSDALVDDKSWGNLVAATKMPHLSIEPIARKPRRRLSKRAMTLGAIPRDLLKPHALLVRGLTGVFHTPLPTPMLPDGPFVAPRSFAHLALDVLAARFTSTLEAAVSKIFCAGAGWQLFALLASSQGLATDSLGFYAMTGIGDALGVGLGHIAFRAFSRFVACRADVELRAEGLVALWLGSSALLSGTAWQYVVNTASATQPFAALLVWTGSLCGIAFFAGLRTFRAAYGRLGMEEPTYANMAADRLLAISVGAGTALFVATDPATDCAPLAFLAVGPADSAALAVAKAGLATCIGFCAAQSVQNLALPVGANWLDSAADDAAASAPPPDDEDTSMASMASWRSGTNRRERAERAEPEAML